MGTCMRTMSVTCVLAIFAAPPPVSAQEDEVQRDRVWGQDEGDDLGLQRDAMWSYDADGEPQLRRDHLWRTDPYVEWVLELEGSRRDVMGEPGVEHDGMWREDRLDDEPRLQRDPLWLQEQWRDRLMRDSRLWWDRRWREQHNPRAGRDMLEGRFGHETADAQLVRAISDPRFGRETPEPRFGRETPDPRFGRDPDFADPRFRDPHRDPRFADPRFRDPHRDPRFADPRFRDPHRDPRFADPRFRDPHRDPRFADPRFRDPRLVDPRLERRFGDPGFDPRFAQPHWWEDRRQQRFGGPGVMSDPDERFLVARQHLGMENHRAAAGEIALAARLLEVEAARTEADTERLRAQTEQLRRLAERIENGELRQPQEIQEIDAAAARAHAALAAHHQAMARQSLEQQELVAAGYHLESAVDSYASAVIWLDRPAPEEAGEVIGEARLVSGHLLLADDRSARAAQEAIDALNRQIEWLDEQLQPQ